MFFVVSYTLFLQFAFMVIIHFLRTLIMKNFSPIFTHICLHKVREINYRICLPIYMWYFKIKSIPKIYNYNHLTGQSCICTYLKLDKSYFGNYLLSTRQLQIIKHLGIQFIWWTVNAHTESRPGKTLLTLTVVCMLRLRELMNNSSANKADKIKTNKM